MHKLLTRQFKPEKSKPIKMVEGRIQKILASAGICSRRKAEDLLANNRISVNGEIAKVGDKADPRKDKILLDGLPIKTSHQFKVYLINKPIGIVSTCKDEKGRKTVLDLLPIELQKGLHPAGRLDFESRGAMILTNCGELTLKLTHPRYFHAKTYLVWVEGAPSKETLEKWRNGVIIENRKTIKAKVKMISQQSKKSLLEIVLSEGRNRQIRRVASLLGHPVIDLKRTAISTFKLNHLKEGQWRKIEDIEWKPLLLAKKYKSL